MRTAARPDPVRTAALVIFALTAWRLVALVFDTTDLWVDEAQYWLWGQQLDWGYFSKPPMIAWLARGVTDIAGSDAIAVIRAPGAVLHAITAALVGLIAARWSQLSGDVIPGGTGGQVTPRHVGALAALLYATAPFATLGSWQFSTDTVLLPFYAGAVLAWTHLTTAQSVRWSLVLGLCVGLGFLSKYAMVYLPLTITLAAVFVPAARIALRDAALAAIVALVVFSPNLLWNLWNGAQTLQHTASDNAQLGAGAWSAVRGAEFLASQFAVAGPVLFAAWCVAAAAGLVARGGPALRALTWLSVPTLVLMTLQAARAQAHANWGVTAFVAGIALAALLLAPRQTWRRAALWINGTIAALFPLLFIFGDTLRLPDGDLMAARYVGAAAFSEDVARAAKATDLETIVAAERWLLADLFHTLREDDLMIRSVPPSGKVANFYQAEYPLTDATGDVLYIEDRRAPPCAGRLIETLAPEQGVRGGRVFRLHVVPADCFLR